MKEIKENIDNKDYKYILIEPGDIEGVNIGGILLLPKESLETNKLLTMFQFDRYKSNIRDLQTGEERQAVTIEDSAQRVVVDNNIGQIINSLGLHGQVALLPLLPNDKRIQETLDEDEPLFEIDAFQREAFTNLPETNPYYRIDKQVKKMIEYVIEQNNLDSKTNILGHSAMGLPAMRFSILQPEIIDNLIIGGNADEVPTPIGENTLKLEYPFGIKDFEKIFGEEFNLEDFSKISFRYYIGEYEHLDPNLDGIRDDNYGIRRDGRAGTGQNFAPKEQADEYKRIYNPQYKGDYNLSIYERLQHVLEQYEKAGLDMRYLLYPQDCHSVITSSDLKNAQFENGSNFSKNGSQLISELLERTKQLERYASTEPMTPAKLEYAKATEEIYYNKGSNSRTSRVEALKKIDSEYVKKQATAKKKEASSNKRKQSILNLKKKFLNLFNKVLKRNTTPMIADVTQENYEEYKQTYDTLSQIAKGIEELDAYLIGGISAAIQTNEDLYRQNEDIDIMCKESDLPQLIENLQKSGYVVYDKRGTKTGNIVDKNGVFHPMDHELNADTPNINLLGVGMFTYSIKGNEVITHSYAFDEREGKVIGYEKIMSKELFDLMYEKQEVSYKGMRLKSQSKEYIYLSKTRGSRLKDKMDAEIVKSALDEESYRKIERIRLLEDKTKSFRITYGKDGKVESIQKELSFEEKVNAYIDSVWARDTSKSPDQIVEDLLQSEEYKKVSHSHPEIKQLIDEWKTRKKSEPPQNPKQKDSNSQINSQEEKNSENFEL